MAFRPIDPAKRGIRPATLGTPPPPDPVSDPKPGHHPHPIAEASSGNPDAIATRARIRARSSAVPPGGERARDAAPQHAKRAHHVVDRTGPNWEGGDYIVGKGRPPKATQWQKGQSGNPRGPKPQEKLDPQAAFDKEIMTEFTAKVNGEEVRLNMGTFVVQLLKANAAKGTVKAQQMLLDLFLATMRKSVAHEDAPEMEAWEQQVIDKMLEEYGLPAAPVFRKIDRTVDEGDEA